MNPKLIIHGAGRMGRLVYEHLGEHGFELSFIVSRSRPEWARELAWRPSLGSMEIVDYRPAAVLDFSLPGGTCAAAEWCEGQGVPLVSGTTGLGASDRNALELAADRVPVLHAANFSVGVNVALELVTRAAELLAGAAPDKVQVSEVHHAHKQDAPSGTALALAERLGGLEHEVDSRREGEVIGEHRVRFELPGESLTLEHRATDRAVFAHGALRAARWLSQQEPGRFSALDWLTSAQD